MLTGQAREISQILLLQDLLLSHSRKPHCFRGNKDRPLCQVPLLENGRVAKPEWQRYNRRTNNLFSLNVCPSLVMTQVKVAGGGVWTSSDTVVKKDKGEGRTVVYGH